MEVIYHEQQEGQLCAQHCLNTLLQEPFYTAVDLAEIANNLDKEEGCHLEERSGLGVSQNMDDTGFFSVQVLSRALQIWGLELIPFNSTEPRSVRAQAYPTKEKAYICNFKQHWLTIRRLGNQWFNLNSHLAYPELLSDSYLSEFLGQIGREGYSIFVVGGNGQFPHCFADEILLQTPAVQEEPPPLIGQIDLKKPKDAYGHQNEDETQRALEMDMASNDPDLQKALKLSRESLIADARDKERLYYFEESDVMKASKFSQEFRGQDSDFDLALKLSKASFQEEKKSCPSQPPELSKSGAVGKTFSSSSTEQEPMSSQSVGVSTDSSASSSDGQRLGGMSSGQQNTNSNVHELRLRRIAFLEKQVQAQKNNGKK